MTWYVISYNEISEERGLGTFDVVQERRGKSRLGPFDCGLWKGACYKPTSRLQTLLLCKAKRPPLLSFFRDIATSGRQGAQTRLNVGKFFTHSFRRRWDRVAYSEGSPVEINNEDKTEFSLISLTSGCGRAKPTSSLMWYSSGILLEPSVGDVLLCAMAV